MTSGTEYEHLRGKSVKATALNLLQHVDHHVDPDTRRRIPGDRSDARSCGLPYQNIVEIIRALHPDAETSVESLRWYVVKAKDGERGFEGVDLPWVRPRKTPTKRTVTTSDRQCPNCGGTQRYARADGKRGSCVTCSRKRRKMERHNDGSGISSLAALVCEHLRLALSA